MDKRQRRFDRLQRIGCIACLTEDIESQADIHHIISKGYRKHSGGDEATIPLCPYHHRGQIPDGMTRMEAEAMYGPSLALSKREFVLHFGTEQTLLALVDHMIEQMIRLH